VGIRGRRLIVALLAAAAVGALGATIVMAQLVDPPAAEREALAETTKPKGAKMRTLGLSRVVIPVGAKLALHRHEGTQIAYIQRGVLTYTVRNGKVAVRRGPADGDFRIVSRIRTGQTGQIKAGQWIVEQPSDIHRAENRGDQKIVIYLATLLRRGAPPSTPVDD
jgi:quercetin dioxygenase-like cupin family protein